MRMWYAKQSPRGFENEINLHIFKTKARRDSWVNKHRDQGGVNSSTLGARVCGKKEADRIKKIEHGEIIKHFKSPLYDALMRLCKNTTFIKQKTNAVKHKITC